MVSRIEVHSEDMEREHASFPMTLHCDDANAMMQTNHAMLEIPREMRCKDMRSCRKCSSVMYAKGAVGRFCFLQHGTKNETSDSKSRILDEMPVDADLIPRILSAL